jgi:PHD/YefM family antitoxin component YafN of YafNO toxin-antitoxin module
MNMPRTVTLDEAQQNLGTMLQWAKEHNEGVILQQSGRAEGVLLAFDEYAEFLALRKQRTKRKSLEVIAKLSSEASAHNHDLTIEEAYRLAGFSEEVIQEMLVQDQKSVRKE